MLPMSFSEMYGKDKKPQNFFNLFDPNLNKRAGVERHRPSTIHDQGVFASLDQMQNRNDVILWWEGYVKTYLERDLRELSQVESLIDFRRVLESTAIRTGNLLNQTEISRIRG